MADFFLLQDHRLANAQSWPVPGDGTQLFEAMAHAAGGKHPLLDMAATGEWPEIVLDAFCLHCGLHRGLYDPLDPFGKNPPRIWKTRWAKEFVEWYAARHGDLAQPVEKVPDTVQMTAEEVQEEAVKRKRGRPRKQVEERDLPNETIAY